MKINKMFALMGAFLLMSAPLAMNASAQRAARKAVRAKSSKTVSKAAKPKQKKVLKETFTVNGVKFVMVQVEGGTFKMGATPDMGSNPGRDEVQVHTVTLSNFLIGQTEVTQALWQAVMGSNPSYFVGDDRPVERVCYHDCLDFIKKLNRMDVISNQSQHQIKNGEMLLANKIYLINRMYSCPKDAFCML